jgi:uncharacterized protein (DUF58 family)
MASANDSDLVNAETLARLHALDVCARAVVDGMNSGAHKSPFKGHSVDFADHRPYVPGDDLRHLDWKVLGRRDRLVLKRYEAETDLGCSLIVDGSGSMAYQGERAALSKYRYASILAASLAYLVIHQQDRVGLQIFSEDALLERKPSRQDQLLRICNDLDQHEPALGTDAVKGVHRVAGPDYRRGLVVLISDCLGEIDELTSAIERLRHRGHDCAVLWVLDPDELDLGVGTVSRFQGLEGEGEIVAEPLALRRAYADEVQRHRHALEKLCRSRGAVLISASTAEAPQHPLNRLLVGLQHDS